MPVRDKNVIFADEEDNLLQLKKRARRRLIGATVLVLFAIVVLWNVLDTQPPAKFLANQELKVVADIAVPPIETQELAAQRLLVDSQASSAQSLASEAPVPLASMASSVNMTPATLSIDKEALPGKVVLRTNVLTTEESRASTEPKEKAKKSTEKVEKRIDKVPAKRDPKRILEGLDDMEFDSTIKAAESPIHKSVKYSIQVAAYKETAKAQSVVDHLKAIGVRVNTEKITVGQGQMIRVRVGPYAEKKDAQAALKKIHAHGLSGTLVVK